MSVVDMLRIGRFLDTNPLVFDTIIYLPIKGECYKRYNIKENLALFCCGEFDSRVAHHF